MLAELTSVTDPARLAALERTQLMGSGSEPEFERISRLVSRFLKVPVALISLVGSDRQFFKSCIGLPEPWATERQTPLSHSFCKHVVESNQVLNVTDARVDPRVKANLAVSDLGVVAYLGAPLTTVRGHTLGALCAIDSVPRDWTGEEIATLCDLAQLVVSEIETREVARSAVEAQAAISIAEESRRYETRVQLLADSMPQIVWTSDSKGVLQYCNKHWLEYSGMSFEQTRELHCQAIMHPDDIAATTGRRSQAFAAGEAYECEYRFKRASDGMYRWHLGRTTPLRDDSGKIVQWLGICTDIQEKRLTRTKLERSNEELERCVQARTAELTREHRFLEAVLENIADGIVACDENGTLKLFNQATRQFHGLVEEGLPPAKWAEHYSLLRADGVTPMPMDEVPLFRAFNGELVKDVEMVIARKDSHPPRRIIASGRAFCDSDGNRLGAVAAMRDITERVAAEDRFRILFDASSVSHFLLQDGKVLDCNIAAVNLLGCGDKAELLKRHPADFSPEFQPDGRHSATTRREIDQQVIRTGSKRFEWNLRRTDGTDIFVEVSLTAIKLHGKDAIISVCHDLTSRKRSEQALADAKRFAESVADYSSTAIYIRRLSDEALTYMNKEAEAFIGFNLDRIEGRGKEFNQNFFHPDDLARVIAAR